MSRQPLVQQRARTGNLYDVVDVILDKGLVIDAFVRVSLVGIELLTVDARVVVASVDTYLHFAEAVDRLDLVGDREAKGLPELFSDTTEEVSESKSKGATRGALEGGWESLKSALGADDEDEREEQNQEARDEAKEEVS